ncbi:flagellar biosynthetic protein FliO [Buchnera aphidicola]|uniref:flagellar biosynthetic protein FliO n=1 Tax=Buchnera aphidicola TaxID=9 RepID=UPI0031B6BCEE
MFFFYIKKTGLVNTTKTSNSITLLEQFYLTAHQKIIIIKIRKVNLVLGVTEKNINFLYILPSSIKKNYN